MLKGRRNGVAVVALAACAIALGAAPCAAEWRRIDSPNFVVVGDVGAGRLRDIAVEFEGFRETLGRVLAGGVTSTAVPTVVVVFPTDRAFTPVKPLYRGKAVELGGMFISGRDLNYIAIVADGQPERMRTVFHEYAHLIVSNVLRNPPAWLNEGLAEYYSAYRVERGGRVAILGAPLGSHLAELSMRTLMPIDELLKVDETSPFYNEGDRRSVFYAQSWALMHLLLMGQPNRTAEMAVYLKGVDAGVATAKAWRDAFGSADLDKELRNYVRRSSFTMTQFTFPDKLASFDAAVATVPPAEAQGFLAELLIAQRRHEEAAGLLAKPSKLDPANARVKVLAALRSSPGGSECAEATH